MKLKIADGMRKLRVAWDRDEAEKKRLHGVLVTSTESRDRILEGADADNWTEEQQKVLSVLQTKIGLVPVSIGKIEKHQAQLAVEISEEADRCVGPINERGRQMEEQLRKQFIEGVRPVCVDDAEAETLANRIVLHLTRVSRIRAATQRASHLRSDISNLEPVQKLELVIGSESDLENAVK